MSAVLHFSQVSVLREGVTLVDRVDWEIAEGERWVVLGPNGAGKTTLLQLASANLHPSRGTASVLGETLGAVDVFELRPRIGLSSAALAERLELPDLRPIPMSALRGDNVVEPSENLPWYDGPTLLEYLETVEIAGDRNLDDERGAALRL